MESLTMLDPQKETVLKCSTFPRISNEQHSSHFLLPISTPSAHIEQSRKKVFFEK